MIVSGFNVYPSEVEDVIGELPEVAGAAVIGVDDPLTGEAVVAYVTPTAAGASDALVEVVLRHCAERLARFKQPSVVHVVEHLPLHGHRQGPEGPAAGDRAAPRPRAAGVTDTRVDHARVPLYGKPGCHLCDDARAVIERVCAELGTGVRRGRHHHARPS